MPFHSAYSRPTAAQYEAIGRVAANWSVIEYALEVMLARLAGAPDFPSLALTNDLSIENRLTALRNLIAMHRGRYGNRFVHEELLAKFDDIPTKVANAKSLRNKIIHLIWFRQTDEKMFGTKIKAKSPTGQPLEPYQLRQTVSEINSFADTLDHLGDHLFDLVVQLPTIDEASPQRCVKP